MSLKILIIEDEQLGIERLERHLYSIDPGIEVVGTADSVSASAAWLRSHPPPGLILMDVDLGDGQSFDIFYEVSVESPVIFTTSYDEHALQAFNANNIDYLLKPIKKTELEDCLDKFIKSNANAAVHPKINIDKLISELRHQLTPREYRQRFLGKQGKKLKSIELHEIGYFYSDGRLNYVKTVDKQKLVVEHSMDELQNMLDPQKYFRISGNYIIAPASVSRIQELANGHLLLALFPSEDKDKKPIIAPDKVREFRAWIAR